MCAGPPSWSGGCRSKGKPPSSGCIPMASTATSTTIGDRLYAIDLTDPAKPAITDSVIVDARTINDLMTTEDGKYGVLTREGASLRKNGIVILSFEDPAHPKQIAEFTETVTGGVHSTFIYKGYVYLTDDATGSHARHRHPRSLQAEAGGPVGDAALRGRPDAARHRREGRAGLPELLERRPRHPRCRQWHQGRQPGESATGLAVQVRPQRTVSRCRGRGRTGLHPGDPHRLAGRQVRLRGRRGLLGQAPGDRRRGSGGPGTGLSAGCM